MSEVLAAGKQTVFFRSFCFDYEDEYVEIEAPQWRNLLAWIEWNLADHITATGMSPGTGGGGGSAGAVAPPTMCPGGWRPSNFDEKKHFKNI